MSVAPVQLLAYSFPPESRFEGQLTGALERVESGGAMRILDVLFVAREADSGELVAVSLRTDGSAGMIGRLISFRLDGPSRRNATERVLAGPGGDTARAVAAALGPGDAVAAVLVEHTWARALGEAVVRIGGNQLMNEFADPSDVDSAWARLSRELAARTMAQD